MAAAARGTVAGVYGLARGVGGPHSGECGYVGECWEGHILVYAVTLGDLCAFVRGTFAL